MHDAIILIGLALALVIGWRVGNKFAAFCLIIAVLLVSMAAQAHAGVRQSNGGTGICHWWRVQEYRDGVTSGSELWHVNQKVSWCSEIINGKWRFVNTTTRTKGHGENPFWAWGGWNTVAAHHYTAPNRWVFTVSAEEDGMTPIFYQEHNYPKIQMTVYPWVGKWGLTASCGC
jgi:hypothetical protein